MATVLNTESAQEHDIEYFPAEDSENHVELV